MAMMTLQQAFDAAAPAPSGRATSAGRRPLPADPGPCSRTIADALHFLGVIAHQAGGMTSPWI